MAISQIFWILFLILILGAAFFDLFLTERKKRALSLKQAVFWTGLWIGLALLFNLLIYFFFGSEKALEYFTAYLLEKSLSLDNLFVFLIIFSFFDLSLFSQRKVLKWGILGAFLMRAIFIFGGIWLLKSFNFLFFVFGAFLIYSGIRLLLRKERKIDPQKNWFLRIARRFTRISTDMKDSKFYFREPGLGLG